MDIKFIVAVVLVALGLLFDIIGLAIPYWAYLSIGDNTVNYGLWQFCQDPPGECNDFTDLSLSKWFLSGI